MHSKGPWIFLLIALVLAGVAAWGAHRWMTAQSSKAARPAIALKPVVVARVELAPGQQIKPMELEVKGWPDGSIPAGAYSQPKDLVGRVLRSGVSRGEPVVMHKLAPQGVAGGLSAIVPPGFRAVTVKVDEVVGVAGFVQPGDRVDVLVTLASGPFRDEPVSRIVLQNVQVLAVGDSLVEQKDKGESKVKKVKVVTLQVSPEQSETLAVATSMGSVLLALRNYGDGDRAETSGVKMARLVTPPGGGLAVDAAMPGGPEGAQPSLDAMSAAAGGDHSLKGYSQPLGVPGTETAKGAGIQVEIIKGVTRSVQGFPE